MKASGALLLFVLCLCEAGTDVHFELSIDHHENPHPVKPHPMMTTKDPHGPGGPYPVHLLVMNSVANTPNLTFSAEVPYRSILLGAMMRIQTSSNGFNFTYTESMDYGPYLESVNGLAGNFTEHTYWQLLVKTKEGKVIAPDVGIGCYIPKPNQQVYLKFTEY